MSDSTATNTSPPTTEENLTMEQLLENQKEEQKKLTTKIIALRKGVPKSDKRKKREVTSRIADMEYDLKKKHEEEIRVLKAKEAGLDPNAPETEVDDGISLDRLNELVLDEQKKIDETTTPTTEQPKKKVNKAKLRIEKRNAEMERIRLEAEKEAENQPDIGVLETEAIRKLVIPMNLRIKQVVADGHCLYNAFADQLKTRYNKDVTYKELRKSAADHMRQHPDDFKPFLYLEDGNYDKYCDDIVNTACWGGQLEILALARSSQVPVDVIQDGGPTIKICDDEYPEKSPIKLATKVGFMGGELDNPSYKQVKTGTTNHAEVCEIIYDPSQVSFERLTDFFYSMHDPTTLNEQGPEDIGTQYRSAIFYHNDEQKAIAEQVTKQVQEKHLPNTPIVTTLEPATTFFDAEEYHQFYLENNPDGYACPTHYLRW